MRSLAPEIPLGSTMLAQSVRQPQPPHLVLAARALVLSGVLAFALAGSSPAQLKGHYTPGFTGLQNGTQPSAGLSVILPLTLYTTNDIRNDVGDRVGVQPRINVSLITPSLTWVTKTKFLGGNFGMSAIPIAFSKSRIEGTALNETGSFALTDIYVQPIQLGWHRRRADFLAGYGVFVPTGEWELGGTENAGLGMWSHQVQGGATFFFDARHEWTFSTLGSYEFHSRKKNADITVGDIMTVEGGMGRSFYRSETTNGASVTALAARLGLVYYAQFKMTADSVSSLTPLLEKRKDQVWAVGLEGSVMIPKSRMMLNVRTLPEFAARNRTQGWTWQFAVSYGLKPLTRPGGRSDDEDR